MAILTIFWDVMPSKWIEVHQCWRNIAEILLKYMALHYKIQLYFFKHLTVQRFSLCYGRNRTPFQKISPYQGQPKTSLLRFSTIIRDRTELCFRVHLFFQHHRVKENSTFWRYSLSPSVPLDDKVSLKCWNYLLYWNSRWTMEISLQKTYNFINNKLTKYMYVLKCFGFREKLYIKKQWYIDLDYKKNKIKISPSKVHIQRM
jgi:hypothetical protein